MEKPKRWHTFLIVAVLLLTIYNILPTVFYYSQPLKSDVSEKQAEKVASSAIARVNALEEDSVSWLKSFCKLLHLSPESVHLRKEEPRFIDATFKNEADADRLRRFLPKAGALIPFVPAQLQAVSDGNSALSNVVVVERMVPIHLQTNNQQKLFAYSARIQENGEVSPLYKEIVYDRAEQLGFGVAGTSLNAALIKVITDNKQDPRFDDRLASLAKEITSFYTLFGKESPVTKRYLASLTQIGGDSAGLIQKLIARMDSQKTKLKAQLDTLEKTETALAEKGEMMTGDEARQMSVIAPQIDSLTSASKILQDNIAVIQKSKKPLSRDEVRALLIKGQAKGDEAETIDLKGYNPFISSLTIDWMSGEIHFNLYEDVQKVWLQAPSNEKIAFEKEKISSLLINEFARLSRITEESIQPTGEQFAVKLHSLSDPKSFLAFNLGALSREMAEQLKKDLETSWHPTHQDLLREVYPVVLNEKNSLKDEEGLSLVVYAPAMHKGAAPEGFRTGSIYVIARGLASIVQKYQALPNSESAQVFMSDFNALKKQLEQMGFNGYPGGSFGLSTDFSKDFIFEWNDYYSNLLAATRENFLATGTKRWATLDFSDVEQRILTENKIGDAIQEDLLKWYENYQTAQVDLDASNRYSVPKPTKNVYWQNFLLSFAKYFRGDDRKVLKWGLDLSGGKTVRIGLRDSSNRPVTDPEDLKQASAELYTRINKMGVSERTIRVENNYIVLDFPGAQNLSAQELVKASAMYFHVVNEKFSSSNKELRDAVHHFLQDVWNEAVVTNRKDMESINEIAYNQLGGDPSNPLGARARTEWANILVQNGLKLQNPKDHEVSAAFDDTLSSIAIFRDAEFAMKNYGQTHPLIVVFHNFALEGSSLENVQVGYDPTEGNILMFRVRGSYENKTGNPRDDFYAWTSQFSEDRIAGTPKEKFTGGRGWRMAVILNNSVISSPSLKAPLREQATISGRFSQREINQLAADLKAGSLSFKPQILSEQNISPELGKEERSRGIWASVIGLILVAAAMIGYYRFAGLVAFCAVSLNLFIMWGVLQNLDAALTLPGIAGIVLTIGMAVDANVLVFERYREEFLVSGRVASAIQAGYRRAFSAIVDSNITTILAALILIQFDSGPIRGFAVTLIVGILSSMFTGLFMTRYFFAKWVQTPGRKPFHMLCMIRETHFDFLKWARPAILGSIGVILVGCFLLVQERKTIFGMDFTGGYSLIVNLEEQNGVNYRYDTAKALQASGILFNQFTVQELSRPNQLRIQLGTSLEEAGGTFHNLPPEYPNGNFTYEYEKNPRIAWLVNVLEKNHLSIQKQELPQLQLQWTVMSGQFSDAMKTNAIYALSLAILSILIYITVRFEFIYAVSSVIGLVHDVLITLGILGLLHMLGLPVQINLEVVGAVMTIIGYSLNDTIIVFDRIREDLRQLRKMSYAEIINHSLNVTLARTVMTSGTTLLVLLALVIFGGPSIFIFSLTMTIGVFIGTLSSLFIAPAVLLYLHKRQVEPGAAHGLRT